MKLKIIYVKYKLIYNKKAIKPLIAKYIFFKNSTV